MPEVTPEEANIFLSSDGFKAQEALIDRKIEKAQEQLENKLSSDEDIRNHNAMVMRIEALRDVKVSIHSFFEKKIKE